MEKITQTIHVVYIHNGLERGGAEILRRTVLRYVQRDAKLCQRLRLTVVSLRDKGPVGELIEADGIPVICMGWTGGLPSWRLSLRLSRLLRRLKPDVVHTCLYEAHRHGIPAARLAGIPVVLMEEHGMAGWMGWRERLYSRILARMATKVIVVSHAQGMHLIRTMPYPEAKLRVIPNCVDPERLGGTSGFAKGGGESITLTSIGGLREEKNHTLLLHVFQRVLQRSPQCWLNIVGEGGLHGDLESLAHELGIEKHVRFMGEVRNVFDVLAGTDIYVHAGHRESFCIALAEAMYAGCACVGPQTAPFEELTDCGRVAALVPLEDADAMAEAIINLLGHPDVRWQMGKAAAEHIVSHYLPQHHVAGMIALYDELLDDGGKRGGKLLA